MNLHISNFSDNRIKEITQSLLKTNSKYALAVEKSKSLRENIDSIIHCKSEITISAGDCMDFREFLDHKFTSTAIMQQELYKQGYMDCIKLLKMLGVLV